MALELRKYEIPVTIVAAILRLLRSFERSTQKTLKGFTLADLGRERGQLDLYLYDGEYLVFGIDADGAKPGRVLLGFNISKVLKSLSMPSVKIEKLDRLPGEFRSFLDLNLTNLAKVSLN